MSTDEGRRNPVDEPAKTSSWNLEAEFDRIRASFSSEELRAKQSRLLSLIDELIERFQERFDAIDAGTLGDGWAGTSGFKLPDQLIECFANACNDLGLSRHPLYWITTKESELPEKYKRKGCWKEAISIYDPYGMGAWFGLTCCFWDDKTARFIEKRIDEPGTLSCISQDAITKLRAWRRAVAKLAPTSEPPQDSKTESPTNSQPDEMPALSARQYLILQTLLIMKAMTAVARQTTAKIVEKAEGKAADPVQFKKDIASLKNAGFIDTKSGAGGGCWLTTKGRNLASRLS